MDTLGAEFHLSNSCLPLAVPALWVVLFSHAKGGHAASGPFRHEVLICNNINSTNAAQSSSKTTKCKKKKLNSLTADLLQLYNLFSSFYYPLFMSGHTCTDDKGKSVHTSSVMTFILYFYSSVRLL